MSSRLTFAATMALCLVSAREAAAFEVKHSAEGELVRWRRSSVEWTVDRSVREVPGAGAAIEAAVDAWTQRGGAPTLVAGPPDASVEPGFDGKNTIFYAADGYEPAAGALAVTLLSFDDRTGEVLDADVVLNGKYHLAPVSLDAPITALSATEVATYDIGRVVAHEMGHALGLSDEHENPDALMYPFVPRSRVLATSPGADDLAGLAELYGGRASTAASDDEVGSTKAGCTGAVVARSSPRHVPVTTFLAAGLALAAVAFARGRGPRRGRRAVAGGAVVAAAALVVAPPLTHGAATHMTSAGHATAFDAKALVTKASTTAAHGVFRTELELTTTSCASSSCPPVTRTTMWGGTLGGVRQVVGGAHVPQRGEQVGIALEHDRSTPRAITRIVE